MNRLTVLMLLMAMSCSGTADQDLESFYERAERRDLSILFGLALKPRGTNEDGSYRVHKIQYNQKDKEPLTIPVFDDEISKNEWLDSALFDIEEFALSKNLDQENFYSEVEAFSDSVIALYDSLGVITIESYPHLGEFIVFQVNSTEQAIYVKDTSKVHHSSWVKFFKKTEPDRENWYHRKKELRN